MPVKRRAFLQWSAVAGATVAASRCASRSPDGGQAPPKTAGDEVPESIRGLQPMTDGIVPISDDERQARIEKARRLMVENHIDALILEPGSSLFYYTGIKWGLSERPFVAVLPAKGDLGYVCPGFEEARAREQTKSAKDVRVWQEDESPYRVVAQILKDRGVSTGKVGVEERLRFFIVNGVKKEAPGLEMVDAVPVTAGCRVIKSPAEIALMQRAADIHVAAYRATFATLRPGMTQFEFARNVAAAFKACGAPDGSASAQFGQYSAYPHGSIQPQKLTEGDVVLVDGGCSVEGYRSDITRTTVFGKASQRQLDVWNLEKRAQAAARDAAKPGVPCEAVDAAARKVITDAGFGPDYKVPGLPHRTGHGIGLDGHEWTNFVRGNQTPLQPGMCFSDEPMIAIYGEFGIRLEDCVHITENGATFFSQPAESMDRLFA